MEIEQIKELGQVAGIAGLAIGAMVTLGKVVLRKVGRLNQKQSFLVVIIWSVGTFVIVALGITAWWSTNARAVESASASVRAKDVPPATVSTQLFETVEVPVTTPVTAPTPPTNKLPGAALTNRPTVRPVTGSPTNVMSRRVVRREQVLLDLKKPMTDQIALFNGDRLKVVQGAVDAVAGIDVGLGWKPLKQGEVYEARSADSKPVVPSFRAKEIRMLTLRLNLVKNAKEAKLLVEVTATAQLDKARKR